jgi:hypothetical protein
VPTAPDGAPQTTRVPDRRQASRTKDLPLRRVGDSRVESPDLNRTVPSSLGTDPGDPEKLRCLVLCACGRGDPPLARKRGQRGDWLCGATPGALLGSGKGHVGATTGQNRARRYAKWQQLSHGCAKLEVRLLKRVTTKRLAASARRAPVLVLVRAQAASHKPFISKGLR